MYYTQILTDTDTVSHLPQRKKMSRGTCATSTGWQGKQHCGELVVSRWMGEGRRQGNEDRIRQRRRNEDLMHECNRAVKKSITPLVATDVDDGGDVPGVGQMLLRKWSHFSVLQQLIHSSCSLHEREVLEVAQTNVDAAELA